MPEINWKAVAELDAEALPGANIQTASVALRLCHVIRESFPINAVPEKVVEQLTAISDAAEKLEDAIQLLGVTMVEVYAADGLEPNGAPPPPPPDPANDSSHRPASRKWVDENAFKKPQA